MQQSEELKTRVHDFWQANPCESKVSDERIGTPEFFDAVERHRYRTEWHIPQVVGFPQWREKDVLEIGCGMGTDAINFGRAGARYTGVDLTEVSIEMVRRRFELEGLNASLKVADAERLPFEDNSFDLVYSHGVLHHTPDTQRAVNEVRRVLRPGGTAMVMLYHKNSYNYWINIMTLRRIGVRLLGFDWGLHFVHRLTGEDEGRLRELQRLYRSDAKRMLTTQEFLNQNTDGAGNPLARVYTRAQALKMFTSFSKATAEVHFLHKKWMPVVGRLLPFSIERRLAEIMGWHLWILAQK